MATTIDRFVRQQLLDRRHRLEHAVAKSQTSQHVQKLLQEVDEALERMEVGSFGICEQCHETIEHDRLICDPLVRFCLDHLSSRERDALQEDLELAARVQKGLLPRSNMEWHGWYVCYHYEPAGVVSGDYCDVIDAGEKGLYFMVGDVSGKGVAASMLMAHLHAMFRSLIPMGLSLRCMLQHANHVFSESTLPSQYATLVCGRALPDGRVEIVNAGHPFPLLVRDGKVTEHEISSLPVGMFGAEDFTVSQLKLDPSHAIVIYSDGVSDAIDDNGAEYGNARIQQLVAEAQARDFAELLAACRDDLTAFRRGAIKTDDVTLFVLGRAKSVGVRPEIQAAAGTYASVA